MTTTPTSLALANVADNAQIIASTHRNNYSAVQTAVNALITFLSGGTSSQFVQSGGGTTINWAGAYTAYVPVWAASGTAVALNNGTITGSYIQIGKFVHGIANLTMGTTTTYGTGTYTITLPVPAVGPGGFWVGGATLIDNSASQTYMHVATLNSSTVVNLTSMAAPGVSAGQLVPFTFAQADSININFSYQAS